MNLYLRRGLADAFVPPPGTCDPIDTACINTELLNQAAAMKAFYGPNAIDYYGNKRVYYGDPGYDAYVDLTASQYLAQWKDFVAPVTPNPYGAVVWSQKDAAGVWHSYDANNRELFLTGPGTVEQKPALRVLRTTADNLPTTYTPSAQTTPLQVASASASSNAALYWAGGLAIAGLLLFLGLKK